MAQYIIVVCLLGGREFRRLDDEGVIELHLGDLLSFITGADHNPPLGFEVTPEIDFSNDPRRDYPIASTCSNTIYLPLHLTEYENFKNKMDEAMISGHGYGTV